MSSAGGRVIGGRLHHANKHARTTALLMHQLHVPFVTASRAAKKYRATGHAKGPTWLVGKTHPHRHAGSPATKRAFQTRAQYLATLKKFSKKHGAAARQSRSSIGRFLSKRTGKGGSRGALHRRLHGGGWGDLLSKGLSFASQNPGLVNAATGLLPGGLGSAAKAGLGFLGLGGSRGALHRRLHG